ITASLAEFGYAPGPELARALADDSAPPRVFVVHQRGMGGSSVIREVMAERAVHGEYAVFVDLSRNSSDEADDLLLKVFAAVLAGLAQAKLEVDRTVFDDLERRFAKLSAMVMEDAGAESVAPRPAQVSPA